MFNMNTQWHATIKDMPYKVVFGQSPRAALFPDAAKQIVQEEDLQGITASKESAEPVLPTTTSDAMKEKAPQTWVVKKEKVLTWTSSLPSSPASSPPISPKHTDSPVPSPPACLKQPEAPRTLAPLAHVSPTSSTSSSSSGLPSLPSSPVIVETIITPPSAVIPAATISSAAPDHLAFESLSSREGPATFKCKEPDSPETTHESIRKKARENTVHSAIKMSSYYNKTKCTKADDFKEGDMVSFMVPKIDRCSTDLQRIPGVIHSVSGGDQVKYYKVATSVGMIKNKFRSGDLTTFSGTITPNTDKELSVREAALQTNAANKFTVNRCKCKGKCNSGLCSCVKSNINCTNHCHPGRICENTCKRLSGKKEPKLHHKDITTLKSPLGWLTDNHMFLANYVLKKEYPYAKGLQDTLLQQNLSWDVPTGEFVQILHTEGNHWITISNINVSDTPGFSANTVNVYDSLYKGISQETKSLIGEYHQGDKVKINIMNVQQQENGSDCGVFAIAFAKTILAGIDPTMEYFTNARSHLISSLIQGSIPKFPSVPAKREPQILERTTHYKLKPVVRTGKEYKLDILSQF